MARTYEVILDINGRLGNLQGAVNQAQRSLQGLGRSSGRSMAQASRNTQQLQSRLSRLDRDLTAARRIRELNSGLSDFARQTDQARQRANQLYSELSRQERQVEQMRQSFQNLQTARNRGEVNARAVSQGRQELRQAEQGLNQLRRGYNTAQSNAESLNSALRRQTSELRQLQQHFNNAGVSAENFARHEAETANRYRQTERNLGRSQRGDEARQRMRDAGANVVDKYNAFQGSIDTAGQIMSPFKTAVEDAMTFEKKLSELKSISQMDLLSSGRTEEANRNMAALKAQAKELGRTTTKTSNEVVDAQIYMSRTGMQTNDVLKATPTLLKLATSQNMDFGRTADIATNIMMAFGHSTADLAHDANVLAYATTHSNSDLSQLGESMKYAAPVAKAFGSSIEETAALLGFMHDAGIQGSMAGTSLRQTMLRLTAPPKKASKAMEENAITVADCAKEWQMAQEVAKQYGVTLDGNLKPGAQMASVIEQIDKNMSGLSSHEKMAAFSAITGVNAVSGAMNVFDRGAEALKKQTEALRNSDGTLDIMYDTSVDNTWGAEQGFLSAREALSQSIGDTYLPAMTAAYKGLTQLTQGLDTWVQQHQTAVQWIGLIAAGLSTVIVLAGAVSLAFAAWGFVTSVITGVRAAIMGLSAVQFVLASATRVAAVAQMLFNAAMMLNPVGLVVAGVLLLIGALAYLISTCPGVSAALSAAWNHPQGAITGFAELVKSKVNEAVQYVVDRWNTLKSALANPIEAAINFFDHGDVIGGNVKSGEQIRAEQTAVAPSGGGTFGSPAPAQPAIDTSQAQQGVNELGNASNQAAQSTQNLATTVEANSTSAQTLNQNIAQIGEGVTGFSQNLLQVGEGVTGLNTNLTATGEGFNAVNMSAQTTSSELTNLQNSAMQVSPALQQVSQAASSSAPPIQSLGSAASSASSGLSQISGAAGAVASALQSKAAQISSITISAPKVASNAAGGIYKQGAFLTTFAEKSPEAAIPLDKSSRAKELWTQAGQALGTLPGKNPAPETPNSSVAEKIYKKRVEEVQKMKARRQAQQVPQPPQPSTPIAEKKSVTVENAQPENAWSKLSAQEQKILQQAAIEYQRTGRANLPAPTENSSAEYKRRYEQNKKLQEAQKYLPQSSSQRSGTIFSGRVQTQSKLPATKNLPPMTQTLPRQKNLPSQPKILPKILNPTPTFPKQNAGGGLGGLGNIFSGGVKLPTLPEVPKVGGGLFGGLGDLLSADSAKNSANSIQSTPPINITITIQGNANADTMREAGQVMAEDLKRELDNWWRDKQHDIQRASFV